MLRDFPWVNLPLVLIGLAISALGMWRAYSPATAHRGRILGPISLAASAFSFGLVVSVAGLVAVQSLAIDSSGQAFKGLAHVAPPDFNSNHIR